MNTYTTNLFNMAHANRPRKYVHWLIFTLFFGGLPIVIRFVIAVICNEAASSGAEPLLIKLPVQYILLSDVIFFGLVLNAATMANFESEKRRAPGVYSLVSLITASTAGLLVSVNIDTIPVGKLSTLKEFQVNQQQVFFSPALPYVWFYENHIDFDPLFSELPEKYLKHIKKLSPLPLDVVDGFYGYDNFMYCPDKTGFEPGNVCR